MFVDDETGEIYDYSAWSQVVRVEAYDAAGHRTLRNALLYDTVYGEKMYNEDGFNDARYSDGTIRGDILDLDPCGATSRAACPIPASSSPMICWMKTAASM